MTVRGTLSVHNHVLWGASASVFFFFFFSPLCLVPSVLVWFMDLFGRYLLTDAPVDKARSLALWGFCSSGGTDSNAPHPLTADLSSDLGGSDGYSMAL